MHKITTHLWFDREAKEAAELYVSVFKDAKIRSKTKLHDTPSGTVDLVTIELRGQDFTLLSAGPLFKSLRPSRFSWPAKPKERSMHCGRNCPKGVRRSWNSANIRSARDTDGFRTGTAFRGS